ncbi:related to transcription activator amyR [Melanopsichium pennsylvanicum]|uniref:Related to transcription activator amyR n=2 Tax=Melanopsichium pennsylvanicum TaxID=63383 RepID=A0AAJ4XI28_9BASI|nr:related to transcription activator amyR [Melanopsichium pennsylvanicum 4]SNX82121.1 related to transcription activator amyR [Melanopsichium pennsylvanicum]
MPKVDSKTYASGSAPVDDVDEVKDKPKKVLRACDACHHRRVRCNHNNPCDNCIRLNINCTWIKASKGKQASGRRIDLLRKGHNPAAADLPPCPPNQTSSAGHPPITAPSSSGSRGIPPPNGPVPPITHSPRNYQPHATASAMSPPGPPASAASPTSMMSQSLYSRDAPPVLSRNSYANGSGGGGYSRYELNAAPVSAASAQHPSPSSYWSSPSSRSPGHRYSPHNAHRPQHDYPPSRPISSTSSAHQQHYLSYVPHHSPSHSYPQHQPYQQISPHQTSSSSSTSSTSSLPPPSQRRPSNADLSSANAHAFASNLAFATSDSFPERPGESFSELAPDVAASFRLPDFGTSLADSYLNPSESGERRRNVLLDFNGAVTTEFAGNLTNGMPTNANYSNSYDPHNNGRQTFLDVLGQNSQLFAGQSSTPGSVTHSETDFTNEPHPLSDSVLIPSIAIFFERLQSIMPVFTRAWIFGKIDKGEHRTDPQLGAMLIALSAFALTQPVDSADPVDGPSRKRRVRRLLEESVKMRNSAMLGSHPSLEAIMASFFIFGTLFGLGEENAAWFRLREAATLGYLLRIHETSSYEHLDKDEQERRLRAYLLLAITERAYAIQSGSSITFRGNPRKATDAIRRRFDVSQLQDFPNLQSRLFDVVDEKFVDCWNRKCPGVGCDYLDAKRAIQLHRAIKESDEDEQKEKESFHRDSRNSGPGPTRRESGSQDRRHHPYSSSHPYSHVKAQDPTIATANNHHNQNNMGGGRQQHASKSDWDKSKVQKADVEVTRQWLLNRLWMTCRSHSLLTADADEEPLRIDYAIDIARDTLRVCNSLSLRSMEAHGIGLTRKLNDIAQTLVIVCRDYPAIAMSVPFEGDPIKTDPSMFGPYFGPSPPTDAASTFGTHQSPIDVGSSNNNYGNGNCGLGIGDHPSVGSSTNTNGGGGGSSSTTGLGGGVVPLDKAFSPSYAIEAILHKYLDIFKRFRGGDHPYLPELVEAVKELPKMAELSFDKFLREMGLF